MNQLLALHLLFNSAHDKYIEPHIDNIKYLTRVGSIILYDEVIDDPINIGFFQRRRIKGTVTQIETDYCIVGGCKAYYKHIVEIDNYGLYNDDTQNWCVYKYLVK